MDRTRDHPGWADSEPRLVELLRDEILAMPDRRITFARFMERALTEPGLGYYASSTLRPSREGDFLSAPELHPFFGRCLARQLAEVWERLDRPARFVVREHGAGRGTLAATVADGLREDGSPLADALEWQPVDLPGRHPDPPAGPFSGVVLANEFLDALPVHRVERRGGMLVERHVTWSDGWFAEVIAGPSTGGLVAELEADGVTLADGQLAEIRPGLAGWVASATTDLVRGALLVIDYGRPASELYGSDRMAGSLVTYRGHQAGDDPFAAVGRQDITAHVDLTALGRAARESGLVALGSSSQAEFLVALGLGELLSELGLDPGVDRADYLLARGSVLRLLDPRHLGGFRVLAFGRTLAATPSLRGLGPAAR